VLSTVDFSGDVPDRVERALDTNSGTGDSYIRMNNALDTRIRLIHAARAIFAERGYDGASIRDITAAAGANLGAVTYHFGSKHALYEAVVEDAFRPLLERLALAPAIDARPLLEVVEERVRLVFEHLRVNPDLQLLVLQQLGHGEMPAPAAQAFTTIFGGLAALIGEAQRRGEVRPGDATLMAISVASQPAYFALVARFVLHRLSLPGGTPSWDRIVEHGVGFIRAGLESPAVAESVERRNAHGTEAGT
jgi:AcrR family transcriptional regulator